MVFGYIELIIRYLPLFFIFYIPIRIKYLKKKSKKIICFEEGLKLAFGVYLISLFSILIIPRLGVYVGFAPFEIELMHTINVNERSYNLIPFETISQQISDLKNGIDNYFPLTNILANLLLFLPMPIFIKLINIRVKDIYCLLITLCICIMCEILQYLEGYRTCDIDDIILNFFGAVIGMTMFNISKNIYFKVKQNNK
ncbi:MAG: VanZ family protein [Eubacterium sp.]|nr:VanZ family protein [Eubacterium sp.]